MKNPMTANPKASSLFVINRRSGRACRRGSLATRSIINEESARDLCRIVTSCDIWTAKNQTGVDFRARKRGCGLFSAQLLDLEDEGESMMRAFTYLMAVGSIVIGTSSWAVAQTAPAGGGQPPPPLTNLRIYPKDIARPELITTMQGFVRQLGVQSQGGCGYCHVGTAPQFDFASDANPKKDVARRMILMSREITSKLPEVTAKQATAITALRCATCHRGVAVPKVTEVALGDALANGGATAAVAQYKDSRKQSLDYNENALVAYATTLVNGDKADDALTLLQANAELDPNHAPTYAGMAQAYAKKGDKDNQIKSLEKAVQLDPNNQQLKRQLDQLKTSRH